MPFHICFTKVILIEYKITIEFTESFRDVIWKMQKIERTFYSKSMQIEHNTSSYRLDIISVTNIEHISAEEQSQASVDSQIMITTAS